MRWGGRQWTRSATERTSSFRKLIRFYSLVREREPTPRFSLCRVNECSHFVRCAATELNEIADEEEIGAAWNGKKDEAWRGSFTLLHARPLFSTRLKADLHAWTRTITLDQNYPKWTHRSNDFLSQLPPSKVDRANDLARNFDAFLWFNSFVFCILPNDHMKQGLKSTYFCWLHVSKYKDNLIFYNSYKIFKYIDYRVSHELIQAWFIHGFEMKIWSR